MARHYHLDIAVFAADTDRKWADNLLSHFDVPGVEAARQGVARRISTVGVYHIALTWRLAQGAAMSAEASLIAARALLAVPDHRVEIAPWLELRIDRRAFEHEIDARIAEGVESIVPRRRGRPPGR